MFRHFLAGIGAIVSWVFLLSWPTLAQNPPLRCDLQMKSTPGVGAEAACLDLVALQAGGPPIQVAGNATRISTDGFRLCKNAFSVSIPAGADIVFIYDNSGSMVADYAKIDPATGDTSFFHNQGCGSNPLTTGPINYTRVTGPRTVQAVDPSVRCTGNSGDPYNARGQVIAQGIDFLTATSPNSTAGAVGFADVVAHAQPPIPLSVPGNAAVLKASIGLDSIPATRYGPPLRQANAWLNDTSLTNTQKKAIVFISDGEPQDISGANSYLDAVGTIPIFSIFLGKANTQYARLEQMSTMTGGQFFRVDPGNIAMMNQVMQQIIQAITVVNLPQSIEVTNNSWAPPMVSRSTGFVRNPDSSISLALDSIVALKQGANSLSVKITMSDADVRTYPVSVQADGPLAGASTQQLTCHEQPTLALLNAQGRVDSAYPGNATQYDVRLTRSTSDLNRIVVTATSSDTSKGPAWGDVEAILLTQSAVIGATTTNRRDDYAFNGAVANPAHGNNILEAAPNGLVTLTWTHPRDPRETATFTLPGRKVDITPGFIDMVRVTDVPKGVAITTPVTDPIVIRGGVVLTRNGDIAVITHKGSLNNPHGITDAVLNPNNTPTFLFKTASPFGYQVSIFDHLGQFLNSTKGKVDSLRWEQMRGNADSMSVAMSILPVSGNGQQFGTGVYIMKATVTTLASSRIVSGTPTKVTPVTRIVVNRFGYRR